MRYRNRWMLLLAFVWLLQLYCSTLQEFASVQSPTAQVRDVKVMNLNFETVGLAFNINVHNPNPIAATIAGYDYDFLLEKQSFITGKQQEQLTVNANGTSMIQVPVSIAFQQLYDTYKKISQQDSAIYELNAGVLVELPVLGTKRIPLSFRGKIPVLKIPRVDFAGIRLKKLTLSRADLELQMNIDNPNPFSLNSDAYQFQLQMNDHEWAKGQSQNPIRVDGKSTRTVVIPVSLNLFEMGRTAYKALANHTPLSYRLQGKMKVNVPIAHIGQVTVPFDRTGRVSIRR